MGIFKPGLPRSTINVKAVTARLRSVKALGRGKGHCSDGNYERASNPGKRVGCCYSRGAEFGRKLQGEVQLWARGGGGGGGGWAFQVLPCKDGKISFLFGLGSFALGTLLVCQQTLISPIQRRHYNLSNRPHTSAAFRDKLVNWRFGRNWATHLENLIRGPESPGVGRLSRPELHGGVFGRFELGRRRRFLHQGPTTIFRTLMSRSASRTKNCKRLVQVGGPACAGWGRFANRDMLITRSLVAIILLLLYQKSARVQSHTWGAKTRNFFGEDEHRVPSAKPTLDYRSKASQPAKSPAFSPFQTRSWRPAPAD